MKNALLLFLFFLHFSCYAQLIYSDSMLNLSSPRMIETSDGGFLYTANKSGYTPNSTPFEGVGSYKIHKLDANGAELWSALSFYFSPKHMFETSAGDFVSITGKFTGSFYICGSVGYLWGTSLFFSKIDSQGNIVTEFEINPGCENQLGSVLQVAPDQYLVAATFITGPPLISGQASEGQLFWVDAEGNISMAHTFPEVPLTNSALFFDGDNNINLLYLDPEGNLTLHVYDASLELIDASVFNNLESLFGASFTTSGIDAHYQPTTDHISVALYHRIYSINSDDRLKLVTFDPEMNLVRNYDYLWSSRTSNRVVYDDDSFVIANFLKLTSDSSDILLNYFDEEGFITETIQLDIVPRFEVASHLIATADNELLIAGSFDCCNQDTTIGPGKSFLYTYDDPFTNLEEISAEKSIQIFPNPAEGSFQIRVNDSELSSVVIHDQVGRMVFSKSAVNGLPTIDVSALAKGLYFLAVETMDGEVIVKKLMVQ